jgi:hypothetical protein
MTLWSVDPAIRTQFHTTFEPIGGRDAQACRYSANPVSADTDADHWEAIRRAASTTCPGTGSFVSKLLASG